MKKLLLSTCTLWYASTTIYAQFSENAKKFTFAGAPLLGNSQAASSGFDGLFLKPSVGVFLSHHTSLELNFIYAFHHNLQIDNIDGHYHSYSFVPSIRHRLLAKKPLHVFGEAGVGFGTIKYQANDEDFTTRAFDELSGGISIVSFGLGVVYLLSEKMGLELSVPYILTNNVTSRDTERLYEGFAPTFGLTFLLGAVANEEATKAK